MTRVCVIGMGALGLMYGTLLAASPQVRLEYVMDADRAAKYRGEAFTVNGTAHSYTITAAEEAREADIVIVAVKYPALQAALDTMKNCVGKDTVVMSVMNGITSEQIIKERYPEAHVIYAVAQGMDAMKFGCALQYTQYGKLFIGVADQKDGQYLQRVIDLFDETGMPYVDEENIMYRLWSKFMLNVGINQTCMVFGQTYGEVLAPGESNRVYYAAMREVLAVARAEGIPLSEKEVAWYTDLLKTLDPDSTPSMGQDRINRRKSEVDMFAGAVMELGARHGIAVPTNTFLYERAKEIEKEYC